MSNKNQAATGVVGHIPMRGYLRQFLQVREGITDGQPLVVPGKTPIKILLDTLLTNKSAAREDKRHHLKQSYYNTKQKIIITAGVADWGQLFFTPTRVIKFNSFVRQLMLEGLVAQTISNHKRGVNEKTTIYQFIEDHKMYDVDFQTLKKATFRYRKMQNMEGFSASKKNTFTHHGSNR